MSRALPATLVAAAARVVAPSRGRLLILIYHRVHAEADPLFPREPTLESFAWQMELLARHAHPLSLHEAMQGLQAGRLPPRAVAVTFDDGYADNATLAAPILKRCGVAATFFVATGYLDGGRMWNDTVIETVRRLPQGAVDLREFGLEQVVLADAAARRRLCLAAVEQSKHRPYAERQAFAERFAALSTQALPDALMMSSAQLRAVAEEGIEIGGHTVTHPILRMLDAQQAEHEILDGKLALERITGRPCRYFAYPNGRPGEDYDAQHVAMVRQLGFAAAVSTRRGVCAARSDRWQLPRFTPWDQTPERFLGRMLLEFRNVA